MKIVRSAEELKPAPQPVCLAIGFFDGVHLGHQQIIRQTVTDARQKGASSLVITFDQHPTRIIAPERTPALIQSLPQRLRSIEALGVNALWLIRFDHPFSQKTGEQFVREMAVSLGSIRSVCVGANFKFGYQRSGDVALLERMGSELGFKVHGLAAVSLDGQVISSTRIRQAIAAGDLDAASQMLGRAYSLAGEVIRGDQLGRQLGFPTANLQASGICLPTNGVYAADTEVDGRSYRAVVNIGLRPTLKQPEPQLRVEAFLMDFDGDLYGRELELIFLKKLRDETRFASLEELRRQIERDVAAAVELSG